eukprot:1190816-Prorocentrum_minimum.AAC.1
MYEVKSTPLEVVNLVSEDEPEEVAELKIEEEHLANKEDPELNILADRRTTKSDPDIEDTDYKDTHYDIDNKLDSLKNKGVLNPDPDGEFYVTNALQPVH